ncbi:hypothetical protein [Falsiroseomonas sp.]|uniref:hypothetical protein n=1 Tax=Falsiroseomonas sp. TaxID=2870721 RepID=UPI003F72E71C
MSVATLLAGCESMTMDREMRPGFAFGVNPALGAIVGSIETFGPWAYGGDIAYVQMLAADVMEEDGRARPGVNLVISGPNDTPDGRIFRAPTALGGYDFETPERTPVRLFAAVLPERDYLFTGFGYQQFGLRNIGFTRVPQLRVRPKAGTVTYVGNLAFAPHFDTRVRAIALRDQSERDVPRLRQQFDWLQGRRIDVVIPDAPGWPRQPVVPPA